MILTTRPTWNRSRFQACYGCGSPELVDTGGGSIAAAALHRVRGALAQGIQQSVAAPQSGLAQALLLGIRAELPPALRESFRDAGMSHLLAISGLHVGVVMALALGLGQCIAGRGNPRAILAAALIVWTYATLSGLDPPVVRSAIMGTLVLLQPLFGRGIRMPTTLLLAAAAMLAVDPWLLESLSFQLSFAAMAGVVLSLPIITAMSSFATAGWSASDAWAARWGQYGVTLLGRLTGHFDNDLAGDDAPGGLAFRRGSTDERPGDDVGDASLAGSAGYNRGYCAGGVGVDHDGRRTRNTGLGQSVLVDRTGPGDA